MSNRKRILKFCSDKNLTVKSLVWERNWDYAYGDSWDTSCWQLVIVANGEEHLYAPEEDTTELAIQKMFENIEEDLKDNVI
jgi:hypothetical protein